MIPWSVAAAQEPALEGWEQVDAVERPAWIVGTVWLRDGESCRPAKVEDAARGRLAVAICAERDLTCDALVSLEGGFHLTGERCRAGADEVMAPVTTTHSEPLTLVHADEQTALFRPAVELRVFVPTRIELREPCTRASLKALARAGEPPPDGHRTCDRTERVAVEPVPIGHAGELGGVGQITATEPVDCTQPCPPAPVAAELERLTAAITGARFVARDAETVGLFRTQAACAASTSAQDVVPDDLCERLAPRVTPR